MQLAKHPPETELKTSPSIRAASIDSLFEAPGPLLAGIIFVAIAAAMTALKTGEDLIWACVVLLVASGANRVLDLQRYLARKATLTSDEAAQWHKRYQFGALVQAAAIGTWCSVALTSNDDAVVHMICLSVTTGIVAGGAGRAYGRPSIFRLQALLQFGPAVIALALRGTPYYVAMSAVSAAFLLAIMQLSANLHRIFMQAVVAREREAALATQFDTALNNMPHGLCMFT
ncbi:MAG: diguanylate cyclase, partial [Bradyrhizobium sp.]